MIDFIASLQVFTRSRKSARLGPLRPAQAAVLTNPFNKHFQDQMTNHESFSNQANALSQQFEAVDQVLADYARTKSDEDSKRFDKILVQIAEKWQTLKEAYQQIDDQDLKERYKRHKITNRERVYIAEQLEDEETFLKSLENLDKGWVLKIMSKEIQKAIGSLERYKHDAANGIIHRVNGMHMFDDPKSLAGHIRELLTRYFP